MSDYLEKQLERHFQYKQFRTGQKEIIEDILLGNDVLGVLPTGSGKSLCYQLPSLLLSHLTVVISPLISLMVDQVRETKAFHFKNVVALHSMMSFEERRYILQQIDRYKIIYISPELIQNKNVVNALVGRKVSLFVIDEAHCISQWGHDFRPDYLRLNFVVQQLNNPQILALSGTITKEVESDIIRQLARPQIRVHKYQAERKNIALIVERISKGINKDERLIQILREVNVPTIIYFSSRKKAEKIANMLRNQMKKESIAYYHGGLDQESRLKIQQQFMFDQLQIICATSAFGMGINKQNIRLVIHYHLPTQKESFIQEIGRAGRDGEHSVSILLYENGDEFVPLQLIENELPDEFEIRKMLNYLYILYEQKRSLLVSNHSLAEVLQMDEGKIKFLRYQMETRGIIDDNEIRYERFMWNEALSEIMAFCDSRKKLKYSKFKRMLSYVNTMTCLRNELYKDFQHEKTEYNEHCCSSCGFTIKKGQFESVKILKNDPISWQKRLAFLLEIGEENETD